MNFDNIKTLTPGIMIYLIDKSTLNIELVTVEMIHKKRGILISDIDDHSRFMTKQKLGEYYIISKDSTHYHQLTSIVKYLRDKKKAVVEAQEALDSSFALLEKFTNDVQSRTVTHFHGSDLVHITNPKILIELNREGVLHNTIIFDETTIFQIGTTHCDTKRAPLTKPEYVFSLADDIVRDSNTYQLYTFNLYSAKVSFNLAVRSSDLAKYIPSKEDGIFDIFDKVKLDIDDGNIYVVTAVEKPDGEGGYFCTLIDRKALFYRRDKDKYKPFQVYSNVMSHYDEDAEPTVNATAKSS